MHSFNRLRLTSDASVLNALAVVTPTIAVIAPLQLWVPAVAASIAIGFRRLAGGGSWAITHPALVAILVCIVSWGTVSAFWAVDWSRSLEKVGTLVLISAALALLVDVATQLNDAQRASFRRSLIFGAVAGITLTLLLITVITAHTLWVQGQQMELNKLSALNRTASAIAILAWPATISIAKIYGRSAATTFLALSSFAVFCLAPLTPLLAFLVGLAAFAVAWTWLHLAKVLFAILFTLSILVIPFLDEIAPLATDFLVTNFRDHFSEVHRFVIWQFASEHILERPIIGWGLNAARVFPGGGDELLLLTTPEGMQITGPALPLHTHNALIQIWLELGFIGVILFTVLLGVAIHGIRYMPEDPARSAAAMATITTGFVIAQLGFGFWQGWWLAIQGIAVVTTVAICATSRSNPQDKAQGTNSDRSFPD